MFGDCCYAPVLRSHRWSESVKSLFLLIQAARNILERVPAAQHAHVCQAQAGETKHWSSKQQHQGEADLFNPVSRSNPSKTTARISVAMAVGVSSWQS